VTRSDTPPAPVPVESFELIPLLGDGQPDVPVAATGVVPFGLAEAEARDRFDAWIAKRRPIGSRHRAAVASMRAVYVPCWSFSARVRVPWRAMKLKATKVRNARHDDDPPFESVPIDGVVDLVFDDETVPASDAAPADLVAALEPAPAADLIPCLPGAAADPLIAACTVSLRQAWDQADARMQDRVDQAVRRDAGLTATDLESWPEWSGRRCRQVLAPIYVVDYGFRGARYAAVVHGRSGAVEGRRPPDWIARVLAAVIVLGVLVGLGWLAIAVLRWLL
jgi:hypothetical protein